MSIRDQESNVWLDRGTKEDDLQVTAWHSSEYFITSSWHQCPVYPTRDVTIQRLRHCGINKVILLLSSVSNDVTVCFYVQAEPAPLFLTCWSENEWVYSVSFNTTHSVHLTSELLFCFVLDFFFFFLQIKLRLGCGLEEWNQKELTRKWKCCILVASPEPEFPAWHLLPCSFSLQSTALESSTFFAQLFVQVESDTNRMTQGGKKGKKSDFSS